VTFEFWIWNMVCAPRYGWPPLPLDQCRCDMSRSRRFSLPGALGKAAAVLGTAEKDKRGTQLIQRLTRPHTPTKNRPAHRWTPQTAWPDFLDLYSYCGQDVVAEDAAAARIPELTPSELATWQTDQVINLRGVQVDTDALDAALDILGQAERKYTLELATLTGGAVGSVSEVARLTAWLAGQGAHLPDMRADTVTEWLGKLPPGPARRALEIRAVLGGANVKKLRTLKLQVSSDGRLRDQYMYCGADRTGRWSAGGVQLQNLTGKGPHTAECEACGQIFNPDTGDLCPRCGAHMWHTLPAWSVEAVEQAVADVLTRDLELIERVWGDPVTLLAGCLRGLFTAKPGHDLVCVDFSAIEAVVIACLARCQWRIDALTAGRDIYLDSGSRLTGTPYEDYQAYKKEHGGQHPDRKKFKIFELALAYGGWIGAVMAFGGGDIMEESEIKQTILAWREASPEIVAFWGGQFVWCGPGKWDYRAELHGLEGAMIQAIMFPGQCFHVTDISYAVHNDVLYCRLPSGRFLHYHKPRLTPNEDKLHRGPSVQISFEGYNSNPTKGPVGWHRLEIYGARAAENVTQAVAADLQADALKRCEAAGYPIVMHTHDCQVAEVPEGFGSVKELAAIACERPPWAAFWPIKGSGWRNKRYGDD